MKKIVYDFWFLYFVAIAGVIVFTVLADFPFRIVVTSLLLLIMLVITAHFYARSDYV